MPFKDRSKQREASKKHYDANKELVKKRSLAFNQKTRKRNKAFIQEYLSKNPCVDCGETDIIVLEFDHIENNKLSDISTASHICWGLKKLKKEIDKCEVRCANCHRRITYKRRKETEISVV